MGLLQVLQLVNSGRWEFVVRWVILIEFGESSHGDTNMNQNAKRNLQRRKRQAMRLSKREYFRKKKEAANQSAGKDKVD